jgi:hypothetical protein
MSRIPNATAVERALAILASDRGFASEWLGRTVAGASPPLLDVPSQPFTSILAPPGVWKSTGASHIWPNDSAANCKRNDIQMSPGKSHVSRVEADDCAAINLAGISRRH